MKKLLIIALVLPMLFSCSKNEGCNDIAAINFDKNADFDNGTCVYSKVNFYADSTRFGGLPIDRIDITIDNIVIGSFSTVYRYPITDCDLDGTVAYHFGGTGSKGWTATIYRNDGSSSSNSGTITHNSNDECILVSALP